MAAGLLVVDFREKTLYFNHKTICFNHGFNDRSPFAHALLGRSPFAHGLRPKRAWFGECALLGRNPVAHGLRPKRAWFGECALLGRKSLCPRTATQKSVVWRVRSFRSQSLCHGLRPKRAWFGECALLGRNPVAHGLRPKERGVGPSLVDAGPTQDWGPPQRRDQQDTKETTGRDTTSPTAIPTANAILSSTSLRFMFCGGAHPEILFRLRSLWQWHHSGEAGPTSKTR